MQIYALVYTSEKVDGNVIMETREPYNRTIFMCNRSVDEYGGRAVCHELSPTAKTLGRGFEFHSRHRCLL
jgi:hypothetical protein